MVRARMMEVTYRQLARAYRLSLAHVWRIAGRVPIFIAQPARPKKQRGAKAREARFQRRDAALQQVYALRRLGYSYRGLRSVLAFRRGSRMSTAGGCLSGNDSAALG